MFQKNTLTGVLDFYYACNGYFIYDLAITVNDWCTNSTFKIDHDKQKSLIGAYEQVRRLKNIEKKEWNTMLRFASLRFWLSRLNDQLFPTDGDLTTVLDPDHFKNILKDRKSETMAATITLKVVAFFQNNATKNITKIPGVKNPVKFWMY